MVLEALRARMASTAVGLDEQEVAHPSASDPSLQEVEQRLDLGARLDRLDARSRRAVVLRFGLELSQREIAERLGISQMHVSRLLRAAMVTLADEGEDGDAVRT
jgi:RNA polymerase sigma-B factor